MAPSLKRRLERLERIIANDQRILETQILVRLSNTSDALKIQQQQEFRELSQQLQCFIHQISLGHTMMSQLVLTGTATQIQALEQRAARKKAREHLLASIKYPEMNARKNQIDDSWPETCFWILDVVEKVDDRFQGIYGLDNGIKWDNFVDWLKSDGDLYWIYGKTGSGKSTLMKFLCSRPETKDYLRAWRPEAHLLSHYLWNPGSIMQKSAKGVWSSLLHQLLLGSDDLTDEILRSHPQLQRKDCTAD